MWALEHIDEWGARVSRVLGDMNIASVHLCVAPLKNYGNFSWYEPPLETMPDNFGLVICDGPPGGVHGGRAGLLPIMRDRLARCSTILIDDTSRKQEETIARQWSHVLDASLEYCGDAKSFAAIRIGV